jgi:dolichol-phosphate mannosyltransferase
LGGAYVKGMRYAIDTLHADILFEFDADLSHDPEKIPVMLKKLDEGYDMATGSRYIPGGNIPANWGLHRKFLSVVGNLVCRTVVADFAIHDWTGGFRGLKRGAVERILPEMDREEFTGYTFQIGFLLKARRAGLKVAEVPFHFKDRTLGKSKMPASYIKTTLLFILRVRMTEIVSSRIFKFAIVGMVGAMVQLSSLQLIRTMITYQLAYFLSVELAVVSNFILSNVWTFKDRRLQSAQIPAKFVQFNLASAGSIGIQQVLAFLGERFIGLFDLFKIPFIQMTVDTGLSFAVIGILLGMIWNFMAYSRLVWKENKKSN